MQMKKRLLSICFVFALLCVICLPAYAAVDVPNPDKTGTITVNMQYNGQPVAGGTLSVYRVGQIYEDDGNYSFTLTDDFADSKMPLNQNTIVAPETAEELSDFADEKSLEPDKTGTIDKAGHISLDELELGLYLVKQNQAAPGYLCVDPFLVTVPYLDEKGIYQYEVDASPKVSEPQVAPTGDGSGNQAGATPAPTATPLVVEAGTQPGTTLPQTGQLNWPIPVLVVLGLALFTLGWFLRYGKKDRNAR